MICKTVEKYGECPLGTKSHNPLTEECINCLNRLSTERICSNCGWEGTEVDCNFGHNDFYCPKCREETLYQGGH